MIVGVMAYLGDENSFNVYFMLLAYHVDQVVIFIKTFGFGPNAFVYMLQAHQSDYLAIVVD